MSKHFDYLIASVTTIRSEDQKPQEQDVIKVSDTVSTAASVYEIIRNTLEYDEEHLLRRNAVRRILKRRLGETDSRALATKLIHELIWAKYLPNERVPIATIEPLTHILEKYHALFRALEAETSAGQKHHEWLLDILSTEIEYFIALPCIDEALASFAYQELKARVEWKTPLVEESDQDLLLYAAVHRAVLKSNRATLRFRLFSLYYPSWRSAKASDAIVREVQASLQKIISTVEEQLDHPVADFLYRFVRRQGIVFHLIGDIAKDNPEAFQRAVQTKDLATIDSALTAALQDRSAVFRTKLNRTVLRATLFLLLTKSILALLVEYPYELLVLKTTDFFPLAINILFPPFLLATIGLSARIPQKRNTVRVLEEAHTYLGLSEGSLFPIKRRNAWERGLLGSIFNIAYALLFAFVVVLIAAILRALDFNGLSIFFFLFFLSLVAYFGYRARDSRRELTLVESTHRLTGTVSDMLFLPIVRAGRWVALRAPRINIFLFFFDFIIEAPFKAAIEIIESWVAFLKEKRDEI